MPENRSMHMVLPANPRGGDSLKLPESWVLTLIPADHDRLYYYEGKDPAKGTLVSEQMARTVIMRKKASTDAAKFTVVLKPSPQSTYRNVVDLLDELLICDVRHSVMTDISPAEVLAINANPVVPGE